MKETNEQHINRVYLEAVARNSLNSKLHKPFEKVNWKESAPHLSPGELVLPARLLIPRNRTHTSRQVLARYRRRFGLKG